MHVCMWMHKHTDSNHYNLLYSSFSQYMPNTHQGAGSKYSLSMSVLWALWFILLFQYATAFRNKEQGHMSIWVQIFMKIMVSLSFVSSALIIPSTWSKHSKASRDNGGVQTKDFIDEYLFTLFNPPGESLNSYFLCPKGCWRWHILILVWFD